MRPWIIEHGTLWSLETGNGLPPHCPARVEVEFAEVGNDDLEALATAMNLSTTGPIQQRLLGNRRCFCLRVGDQAQSESGQAIAAYGWVTRGVEHVGELERNFHLQDDEAYIWDCRTMPVWRGQHLYSALLSHIVYRLHEEGIARIWIGASRLNRPSVQGMANAGFQPVVDCTYRRLYRLTLMWIKQVSSTDLHLISAAYRILLNGGERRIGPIAIGYFDNR